MSRKPNTPDSTHLTVLPLVPARRRAWRLASIMLAIGAALACWAIAQQVAGISLRSPTFTADQRPANVGALTVTVVSGLAGLAAWALLAVLERATRHPHMLFRVIAVAVLLLSLGGPLSGQGISTPDRTVLAILHVVVGAVLIGVLGATARRGAGNISGSKP